MQARYKDGRTETWTGLSEDEAREMTAERARDPEVVALEMVSGASRHDRRRRDAKTNRKPRMRVKKRAKGA